MEAYSQPNWQCITAIGEDAVYVHVEVRDVPRCANISSSTGTALEIIPGQVEAPLPKAAIRAGLFLKVEQLDQLMGALDIPAVVQDLVCVGV